MSKSPFDSILIYISVFSYQLKIEKVRYRELSNINFEIFRKIEPSLPESFKNAVASCKTWLKLEQIVMTNPLYKRTESSYKQI